jgi:hypothetical protein
MKLTRQQKSIGISLFIHAVLLTVLLFWYLPRRNASSTTTGVPRQDVSPPADLNRSAGQSISRSVPDDRNSVGRNSVDQQPDVSPQEIEDSIESQIEQVAKLPEERKRTELEKNLRRLESVASEQSVAQVSSTIARSLGLDKDQYARKQGPADGEFDTSSAQISDVIRTKDDRGSWQYETVMVDAAGRKMRVPLGSQEGEKLHDTFELMNRFPMARGVYQSVVMPMLQKMLESDSSDPSGRSAEPTVIVPSIE